MAAIASSSVPRCVRIQRLTCSQLISIPYDPSQSLETLCERDLLARLKGVQSAWGIMIDDRLKSITTSDVVTPIHYGHNLYIELNVKVEYDVVGLHIGDVLLNVQLSPSPLSELGVKKHKCVEMEGIPFSIVVEARSSSACGNIIISNYSLDRSLTYDALPAYYPHYVPIIASRVPRGGTGELADTYYGDQLNVTHGGGGTGSKGDGESSLGLFRRFPPESSVNETKKRLLDPFHGVEGREQALKNDILLSFGLIGRKVTDNPKLRNQQDSIFIERVPIDRLASRIEEYRKERAGSKTDGELKTFINWDVHFSPVQPIPFSSPPVVSIVEWTSSNEMSSLASIENVDDIVLTVIGMIEEYYAMKLLELNSFKDVYGDKTTASYSSTSSSKGADDQTSSISQHISAGVAVREKYNLVFNAFPPPREARVETTTTTATTTTTTATTTSEPKKRRTRGKKVDETKLNS